VIPSGFKVGNGIVGVEALPRFRLRLTYADGYSGELDFWPYIERGEAMVPLKDPVLFATTHVGSAGASLEWIGPMVTKSTRCRRTSHGPRGTARAAERRHAAE
jgi:hypothetical protein